MAFYFIAWQSHVLRVLTICIIPHGKMDKVKTKEMCSSGEELSRSRLQLRGSYKRIRVQQDWVWLTGQFAL